MELQTELIIKGLLCLVAIPVVLRYSHAGRRFSAKRAGQALIVLAGVALAAYTNFGFFHGRTAVHYWEQFHYFLGSKYFPELGYDGLYVASIEAQLESTPERPLQAVVRDLRSNEVVGIDQVAGHRAEVRRRFSPERWRGFVADHRHFLDNMWTDYLYQVRRDHGYNPPPSWTFMARLATARVSASRSTLVALGGLDALLLGLAFWMLIRTYGSRIGALSMLVFGLGYPWRYDWIGGALLRLDWLAAVVFAVCLLKRERFRAAGACLAYAGLVRLFPLAFLFGPGVLFVRDLIQRRPLGWALKMAQGFGLIVLLGIAAGAASGRGPQAWSEFAAAIELHHGTWLTNNVGLDNLMLYGPETMQRKLVDWELPEPWIHWQEKMNGLRETRRVPLALASLLLLGLLAVACWQAEFDESVVLGVGAIFAVFLLTSYYWLMLLLVPVRGGERAAAGALGLSAGLYGLHLLTPSFEAIYGVMSWALLVLLLVWIAPELSRTWRGWRTSSEA